MKPPLEQRAAGWPWLIKKAMNGMRAASEDFRDLIADVMNEIYFERIKSRSTDFKDQIPSRNRIPRKRPNLGIITSADSASVETDRGTHVVESAQSNDN